MKSTVKVFLMQRGSRHRYLIPAMLEKEGMLAGFLTDSSDKSYAGKVSRILSSVFNIDKMERLSGRIIQGMPKKKIHSFDDLYLSDLYSRKTTKGFCEYLEKRDIFHAKKIKKIGFNGANIFYSMNAENYRAILYAKSKGLSTVVDVFIDPKNIGYSVHEKKKFGVPLTLVEKEFLGVESYYKKVYEAADYLICPSDSVAKGVLEIAPNLEKKIIKVPYGTSIEFQSFEKTRVAGRLLWAGGEWIRKGLPYLAEATSRLMEKGYKLDVRIAGVCKKDVSDYIDVNHLNFLGKLSKRELQREMLSAQMFVFPTISEGMAGVVIEALSAGCPVITTRESGVDCLENEKNALLVPKKDSIALENAILKILTDREVGEMLSCNSRDIYKDFSNDAWIRRLVNALRIVSNNDIENIGFVAD